MNIQFSFEEMNLMCIYNEGDSRKKLAANLRYMRAELLSDETELRNLTDSVLVKLDAMSDADFNTLELIPDYYI